MDFHKRSSALVAAAVVGILVCSSAAAEEMLSYANHLPANHPVNLAMETYFKNIEEKSGGELTFEMFPGGALGGGRALLGLVRDGVADTAFVNAIYAASALPAGAGIAEFLHPDPRVLAGAQNEMFLLNCPECKDELAKIGIVPGMYYSTASYYLICNQPVTSLEQAEGMRTRAVGIQGLMAIALGMTPVNLTSDEVYEGMQRGQVECAIAPPGWLLAYNLADVATNVLDLETGAIGGLMHFGINKSVWEGLSDENKNLIRSGMATAVADITFRYMAENEEGLDLAAESGISIDEPQDDIAQKLEQFHEESTARIIADVEEGGLENAEDLAERYLDLVEKWEKIAAEVGNDQAKYAEALEREIFSKIE